MGVVVTFLPIKVPQPVRVHAGLPSNSGLLSGEGLDASYKEGHGP